MFNDRKHSIGGGGQSKGVTFEDEVIAHSEPSSRSPSPYMPHKGHHQSNAEEHHIILDVPAPELATSYRKSSQLVTIDPMLGGGGSTKYGGLAGIDNQVLRRHSKISGQSYDQIVPAAGLPQISNGVSLKQHGADSESESGSNNDLYSTITSTTGIQVGGGSNSSGSGITPAGKEPYEPFTIKSLRGIFLSFLSAIFFSLTAVIVKYLDDIHPGQLAVFRFSGMLLFVIPVLLTVRKPIFGPANIRHFLLLRGLAGATSLYLRYCAFQLLPIADATVIVLSMPVFVCIFARVFLKEPCGWFHVAALGVTFVGIGCTSKLDRLFATEGEYEVNPRDQLFGLVSGLGATLIGSFTYIIVRHLKGLHSSVILFNFSWVALTETSIITVALDGFKFPECGLSPWLLVAIGILSFYGQFLLTKALQAEEAGLVSVTRAASEVVFAFLFQIAFFRQIPDAMSIVGAVLVTSAVLLTTTRKYIIALPESNRTRRVLNFVTK